MQLLSFFDCIALQEAPNLAPLLPAGQCCGTLLILLVLLSISMFALRRARKRRRADQEAADSRAREIDNSARIRQALVGKDNFPFALYLRPFEIDKKIRKRSVSDSRFPQIRVIHSLLRDKVNYDYHLRQEFEALLDVTLLCFDGTDSPGAAHVKATNDTWIAKFRLLAPRARAIVIVPGISDGILNEICWLSEEGLLQTALFLKPKGYPKSRWQEMKRSYEKEIFLEVPNYCSPELSFRIDLSGRCYEECKWPYAFRFSTLMEAFIKRRRLLANRPLDGSNDTGLCPFPEDIISLPWPMTTFVIAFYVFWVGVISAIVSGILLVDALQNPFDQIGSVAIIGNLSFGGTVCAIVALWGIWKGRLYGKWAAVMSLVLELLVVILVFIYNLQGPRQIYQAFKASPLEAATGVIGFVLIPLVLIARLVFSKYMNRFFS